MKTITLVLCLLCAFSLVVLIQGSPCSGDLGTCSEQTPADIEVGDEANFLQQIQVHHSSHGPEAAGDWTIRDDCPCVKTKLSNIEPNRDISRELPQGLYMKHAGWTSDNTDRGIGIFASTPFKKGIEIGSARVEIVPCTNSQVQTELGLRSLVCEIHFFSVMDCAVTSTPSTEYSDTHANFPSWMTFLNSPDEQANVQWGHSTCGDGTQGPVWHLLASKDIAPGDELLLTYDDDADEDDVTDEEPAKSAEYHAIDFSRSSKLLQTYDTDSNDVKEEAAAPAMITMGKKKSMKKAAGAAPAMKAMKAMKMKKKLL